MSRPRVILPEREIIERRIATAPDRDVWVSANAGSGKTTILRNRVVRLLLDGTPPDRILCLTYTKAAAAEMQSRIFRELAEWVDHDDETLSAAIDELAGAQHEDIRRKPARMRRARQLFAEAVETPGGLKIQTIHAFCERLLHHFPIEAGVSTDFQVLDEAESRQLKQEARASILAAASANPQSGLGQAFEHILAAAGYGRYTTAIDEAMQALGQARARTGGLPSSQTMSDQDYAESFGVAVEENEQALDLRLFDAFQNSVNLGVLGDRLGREKHNRNNDGLLDLLASLRPSASPQALSNALRDIFFTKTNDHGPRKLLMSAALKAAHPEIEASLEALRSDAEIWRNKRRSAVALRNARMLRSFAEAVFERYQQAKAIRNGLDYDDLIAQVRMLLERGSAAWVMLKLDAAIEHILVDEAQDTTPDMWTIIRALCDDFYSGQGQSRRQRTLFVVGDEKQSIFSFQGARPEIFGAMRQELAGRVPETSRVNSPVRLTYSFRSSPDVLNAVDRIFETGDRRDGLTADPESIGHRAAYSAFPGKVELWPLEPGEAAPEDPDAAMDAPPSRSPEAVAAERIAQTISGWIAREERFARDNKLIAPGDILILVQQRLGFFEQILRALKNARVPVAGADRLALHADIAVQDLMALGRIALLAEDDLSLATILKSPLVGCSESEVETLCRGRGEGEAIKSLRAHIKALAGNDPRYRALDDVLTRLEQRARVLDPFRFYALILAEDALFCPGVSGRKAFYRRLGPECADAIDAFLAEARRFSAEPGAHLQLFLAEQETREIMIKRDMDQSQDQVRVMTVHSAKGLEARIVILADCTRVPRTQREKSVFLLPGPRHDLLVWSVKRQDDPDILAHQRAITKKSLHDEYRRLFYVGLTRAEDRLCLTGVYQAPPKEPRLPPLRSWYDLAHEAFRDAPGSRTEQAGTPEHPRNILCFGPVAPPVIQPTQPDQAGAGKASLPDWALRAAPAPPEVLAPLRPSRALADASDDAADRAWARRRGNLVHRLFEILPSLPPELREARGLDLLRTEFGADEREQAGILPSVLAYLETSSGLALFGKGSHAEKAVSGRIAMSDGRSKPIIARIDRLVITDGRVLVFDLKSGRAPDNPPRDHLLQIALYAHLAAGLYPDHRIEAGLFYTQTMELRVLEDEALKAALEHLTFQ